MQSKNNQKTVSKRRPSIAFMLGLSMCFIALICLSSSCNKKYGCPGNPEYSKYHQKKRNNKAGMGISKDDDKARSKKKKKKK